MDAIPFLMMAGLIFIGWLRLSGWTQEVYMYLLRKKYHHG